MQIIPCPVEFTASRHKIRSKIRFIGRFVRRKPYIPEYPEYAICGPESGYLFIEARHLVDKDFRDMLKFAFRFCIHIPVGMIPFAGIVLPQQGKKLIGFLKHDTMDWLSKNTSLGYKNHMYLFITFGLLLYIFTCSGLTLATSSILYFKLFAWFPGQISGTGFKRKPGDRISDLRNTLSEMKKIALIVAAGSGSRMKSDVPKQFLKLGKLPLIMHTMYKFHAYDPATELRLVLHESEMGTWENLCREYNFSLNCMIFPGGETRFHSVKNGLQNLITPSLIAVHDGVRPLVSTETIVRCFQLAESSGAAVPVITISESIRKVHGIDSVSEDRTMFRMVQTPQVFDSNILLDAYNLPYEESFTDDSSVVEKAGYKIYLTEGNRENIKITSPNDLLVAEALLSAIKE